MPRPGLALAVALAAAGLVRAARGTGRDITATARAYARDCLTRGATIGGDPEARARAPSDVASFLKRVFRL
jgi:hypothetical protein